MKLRSEFTVLLMVLLIILVFRFLDSSLIGFYFYFEASLIPTFLLILGFGYQPERLQAGLYLIFYTIFGSLPLLFIILLEIRSMKTAFFIPWFIGGLDLYRIIVAFMVCFAFLIKMPMFFVHL